MDPNYRFTFRAWLIKIRLIGNFNKILICVVLLTIALALRLNLLSEINPKSVHVNSYERSDGTKVDSYFRRKPGEAQEDSDEEFYLRILSIIIFGLLIYLSIQIINLRENPLKLVKTYNLKPKLRDTLPLPVKGKFVSVKSRKHWKCKSCGGGIHQGEEYFFLDKDFHKTKYCSNCKAKSIDYAENYSKLMKELREENESVVSNWHRQLLDDYETTYKIQLNEKNKTYLLNVLKNKT